MSFPANEVSLIRDLARRVAEIAALPEQAEKEKEWRRHNALEPGKPLVLIFPAGSCREAMPETALVAAYPGLPGFVRVLRVRIY